MHNDGAGRACAMTETGVHVPENSKALKGAAAAALASIYIPAVIARSVATWRSPVA
jgi:hypothetical protein